MVSSESIFLDDDPPPRKTRARVVRVVVWVLVVLVVGAVAVEQYAAYCRDASEIGLREFCRSREAGPPPTIDDVQRILVGWPVRRTTGALPQQIVVFTWPSVYRSYVLRVTLENEQHVAKLEISSAQDDQPTNVIARMQQGKLATPEIPPPANQGMTSQDLAERVKAAFERPREGRGPAGLIFPVVDSTNRICPAGAAWSTIASYSAASLSTQRLAFDPAHLRQVLIEAHCWQAGTELDQKQIAVCTGTAGISTYVVPKLEADGDRWRLWVECRETGRSARHRMFEHQLAQYDPNLPGLIALDLLEFLGVALSAADRDQLSQPQLESQADAVELSDRIANAGHDGQQQPGMQSLIRRNPRCLPAWDALYQCGRDLPGRVLPRPTEKHVLECGSYQRHLALHPTASLAMVQLLDLAPVQRGSAPWYMALVDQAMALQEDELLATLFTDWEQDATDYPNCVGRGLQLISWAWLARGSGWASTVDADKARRFHERLERARRTLEQALALNPLGWEAHRGLITVAKGLGLPATYMEQHFAGAISIAPWDFMSYSHKFGYLQKRWHGTSPQLLKLAHDCLDSDQWEAGIPQLVPQILFDVDEDYQNHATSYSSFRTRDHWDLVRSYYEGAQGRSDPDLQRIALNYFAEQAAISGHFTEAAAAFDRLDPEQVVWRDPPRVGAPPLKVITEYDAKFHRFDYRYAHLRDIVRAHTNRTSSGLLSAVRVALASARLDDAERLIAEVAPADDDETAEIERCRRALLLGRKLIRDRKLELTPAEMFEVFAEFQRTACRGLDRSNRWSIDGNRLTWKYPGYQTDGGWIMSNYIFFPVGLHHATVTGRIEYSGGAKGIEVISHTQALRNAVALNYQIDRHEVALVRLGTSAENQLLPSVASDFVLRYGQKWDRLSPFPGCEWKSIVYDDVPSTFGFGAAFGSGTPTVSVSNLKIELRD